MTGRRVIIIRQKSTEVTMRVGLSTGLVGNELPPFCNYKQIWFSFSFRQYNVINKIWQYNTCLQYISKDRNYTYHCAFSFELGNYKTVATFLVALSLMFGNLWLVFIQKLISWKTSLMWNILFSFNQFFISNIVPPFLYLLQTKKGNLVNKKIILKYGVRAYFSYSKQC